MENKVDSSMDENGKRTSLYEATRKVMLAAIGAAAIAQEEITNFINRMAERGQLAEQDARRLAEEMKEKRDRIMEERRAERVASPAHKAATKDDVEALNARVAELTRELEELKRSQSSGGSTL